MSDLLFVTGDMGGNVQPMLGVASACAALGHDVRVVGHEQLRGEVSGYGLDFVPYTSTAHWDSTKTQSPLHWVPMLNDRGIATDVRAECLRRTPDVAVVDCLLFPAQAAVRELGITRVVLSHTLWSYIDRTRRPSRGGADSPSYLYGYWPTKLWNSADLNLVTALRELDKARHGRIPANLEWTGPVLPPAAPAVESEVPHVLVSLSTNGFPGQRGALRRIIAALGGLDVRATVTTGGVFDPDSFDAPANVEVTGYADHSALMATSSLLIGHGGHSTTFRALAHGIPVLVIPAYPLLDQRMIGVALRDAGVGRVLRRWSSSRSIRAAAQDLLTDTDIRTRARVLGEGLRESGGASRAAARIDELARLSAQTGASQY